MLLLQLYSNWLLLWTLLWEGGSVRSAPVLSVRIALGFTMYLMLRHGAKAQWILLAAFSHLLPVYLTRMLPWNVSIGVQLVAAALYSAALYLSTGKDPVTFYTKVVPNRWQGDVPQGLVR